ncbi:hypothetical protein NC653_022235 [Populus alba x Populus x berolinensis]|uniref:Uncharacterized protein n=1 Tax=Populus alba x Populus x berolinensis TaxID=444605 RepID=A0AAD6MEA0_9ROSI|nr:hypothetical protein NC653_022235 [Populus alba x Populus x berolinensis]
MELKEGLHQQIGIMKNKLGKLGRAVQKGRDMEKRNAEHVAMDHLIQMAYKKQLSVIDFYRLFVGIVPSKSTVRKASRQVALAFIKRTLARCHKFEDTGSSCFSEPALAAGTHAMKSLTLMLKPEDQDTTKEVDEPSDFPHSQLNEFDTIELGGSTDLGGPQDLGSWLNIESFVLHAGEVGSRKPILRSNLTGLVEFPFLIARGTFSPTTLSTLLNMDEASMHLDHYLTGLTSRH